MKNFPIVTLLLVILVSMSGCLKTRSQLREDLDDREGSRPVPAQAVQDIQPQGQYILEEIKAEITRLEGRVQDLERIQRDLLTKSSLTGKEELKKIELRLTHVEQTQLSLLESLKKLQDHAVLADPNELYKKAKAQFEDENYESASETFGIYLKTLKPKHAEEATFSRGESFFKLKQYKKAIVEYSKFPEKYTRSSHMPEALYKIGLSFESLGMREDARGFYQELIEKYPRSLQAKKAKKKVR